MDAIHRLEFSGLRSSVVVDGSDVPQYGVQYDECAKEATSWIECQPDKAFAIRSKLPNRKSGENYVVKVYLDGHKAFSSVIRPEASSTREVGSLRVSHTEKRQFMFGILELSDDDALLESSAADALGEIKISLYRIGSMSVSNDNHHFRLPPQAQKVHERAKKGLAHNVKYGSTQLSPMNPSRKRYTYHHKTLIVSHVIRYRPLAMLQANGIVPYVSADNEPNGPKFLSSASGPSSAGNSKKRKAPRGEHSRHSIDFGHFDEEGIIEKEKELKEQLAQLQKQRSRLQQQPEKKVKREEKKPIFPGEVIDLTI